jgi:aspartyl-tRNA synthetase
LFLSNNGFLEIETPVLIKSTPEGARDFLVPSRINKGQFYALPQSPQTFKQLLMVAGLDRYFQIVKCFRDEDLRADRQPEFTQIDCELSFVDQNDIITIFSDFVRHIFKSILNVEIGEIPIMEYKDAIEKYGNDKPDTRFDLLLNNLNILLKGKGFKVFDEAETIIGFNIKGGSSLSRKQIDEFTNWIKRPQLGGNGLAYVKYSDNELKSSFDKYIQVETLKNLAEHLEMENGDISFILAGNTQTTRRCASELRLEVANVLKLIKNDVFNCLWVVDFPLLEFDSDSNRWHAMHHPFTSPKSEDLKLLETNPGEIRANAYDLVINGVEVGGGSIRIHNKELQNQMFKLLGFSQEDAESQFGFLMNAFEFGAPPHGGLAFGLDRLCAILGGSNSIRDFIAFPKNNSGRDVMIESPSLIDNQQLSDLGLRILE